MADKKKKVFVSKESATPRRPVILKSDREVPKDSGKEKQEVQPTFILKTREQSTPKDERQNEVSAKTSSEGDGPQISKIAQNENKEKKTEKSVPVLKQMTEPMKLLNENLEFNNAALEFLNDASTNYLVVGIIGTQGVGKSTILNLIAQNSGIPDLCSHILNSHELPPEHPYEVDDIAALEDQIESLELAKPPEEKKGKYSLFKFKTQDIEQIERGVHCTKGVDMYITEDRAILLDCQALWSPSLIDESNANPVMARSANVVTVDCLQVASFLMAICHVLIAVQDWFTDYNFIRYIQAAEMLKPSLSASSSAASQDNSESTSTGECHPHLLLLHNRCQLEDFTPDALKVMQDLYRKAFQMSNLQLKSGMYMYSDANKNSLNVDKVCKGYSIEACGSPINLFLLPEIYHDFENKEIYRGHPSFEQLAKRLRWMILGVNRHQITNVANLSERGWFHYCNKAWETIRKCTFFLEYERFLP